MTAKCNVTDNDFCEAQGCRCDTCPANVELIAKTHNVAVLNCNTGEGLIFKDYTFKGDFDEDTFYKWVKETHDITLNSSECSYMTSINDIEITTY
jgi:hypothetical protein